jgi:hypothetical protein
LAVSPSLVYKEHASARHRTSSSRHACERPNP